MTDPPSRMPRFLLFPLLLLSLAPVGAEDARIRAMSLDDCIQEALGNNLSLQVERIHPLIGHIDLRLARTGWDPVLSTGYTRNFTSQPGAVDEFGRPFTQTTTEVDTWRSGIDGTLPTGLGYSIQGSVSTGSFESFGGGSEFARGNVSIDMRQPLLRDFLIDQTRLNIRIARVDLDRTELGLVWRIMNIVSQVEIAYLDLIAAGQSVKVQEKAVELATQLFDDNRKKVEIGALAPLNEKQAETQLARARADLLASQRTLALQQNSLKNLMSGEYLDWQDIRIEVTGELSADPVPFSRQSSWERAMELRPDLQQRRLDLEREGILVRYNRNQVLPQLDITSSFGYLGEGVNIGGSQTLGQIRRQEFPQWYVGGTLSIPIGNRAARLNLENARHRMKQSLLLLKQFEQDIMVSVENAVTLARINQQRVEAVRQEREFAESALEAEEIKLANGTSTSFVVLQLQRDLTQARTGEIQALVEYNRALAELSLAEGATLRERRISLEEEP